MSLTAGTRLGPYEIVSPLGAGGMGEVYRARDTRLGRDVALKIMPAHLSEHAEVRARFEREARAVSSLNHPNICTLHDIGRHEGTDYLVLELLEGETLAARLDRGPLPTGEALRFAIQIADALDRAHRQGIVHRDLKPGNIMITRAGAKLLDFGLARSTGLMSGPTGATLSPTMSRPLTMEGAIVGTFQYMAPEQLEGQEADARTDIFAFGSVLYEMLAGRRAFEGRSQAGVIGAIMAANPAALQQLAPGVPPALERVVRTCLARDPDDRWQTAHDLVMQLRWLSEPAPESPSPTAATHPSSRKGGREWLWIGASLLLLVVCAGLVAALATRALVVEQAGAMHLAVIPSEEALYRPWNSMAISPDGRRLVYYANTPDGVDGLWLRTLDSPGVTLLKGTERRNASFPFWSPDSSSIGYFIDGRLKSLRLDGGVPVDVSEAPDGRGGTWGPDGTIVFSPVPGSGLMRVAASGGEPRPVTSLPQGAATGGHMWPSFLPDGRHVLFLEVGQNRDDAWLSVGSIDSQETRRITPSSTGGAYARSGQLLFVRDSALLAQPMDPSRLVLSGNPVQIAPVSRNLDTRYGAFGVSDNGLLMYRSGADSGRQLVWYDRSGKRLEELAGAGDVTDPDLSPDGTRLAYLRVEPNGLRPDVWVTDLTRGASMRLTFGPEGEAMPLWSADGRRIYFSSEREGGLRLFEKDASGAGDETLLPGVEQTPGRDHVLADLSPDGAYVVYGTTTTSDDLWAAPLKGGGAPFPLLDSRFNESAATISPDGRWIAYVSDESGRPEVYVRDFPKPAGKWQISTQGGTQPRWRRNGGEIFFLAPDRRLVAVAISTAGDSLQAGIPRPLFATQLATGIGGAVLVAGHRYAPSSDGQRFLIVMPAEGEEVVPTHAIVNWTALLRPGSP